jgi:TPR repeat protein
VPFFLDSEIPAAVFLGLHLLVTDPSTSPRTPEGKLIFGAMYGAGVLALYALLSSYGVPTHYDKLLCVPLLNLSIRGIDASVTKLRASDAWSRLRMDWLFARPNLAHMSVWVVFFLAMTALGRTDGRHTGDSLPFWAQACEEGRPTACDRLLRLEATYCGDASAWACNELGVAYAEGRLVEANRELSLGYFSRACELRFQPACVNLLDPAVSAHGDPRVLDLRLLLREGGRNRMDDSEPALYTRACEHGWTFACSRVASAS